MICTGYSMYEGEGARLYRSPEQIRMDIIDIKERIRAVEGRLNFRSVIGELMSEAADGEPEKWISQLSELLSESETTLREYRRLENMLEALTAELEDTIWILGG